MKPILLNLARRIITQRLIIRPPEVGDGAIVNAAILETFDKLHKVMPWASTKPTIEESEEYVRQAAANWILKKDEEPYLPLFMFDKDNNQFVGGTGFHHINWEVPCLEVGYWIRDSYSGKGLVTEAMNALTRYAISQLAVKRIEIRCDRLNLQSKKIPERLGYQLEATLTSNRISVISGKISDTLVFVRHNLDKLPDLSVSWE
jgi:RimJ/RimL family protein N-acetyltransferase